MAWTSPCREMGSDGPTVIPSGDHICLEQFSTEVSHLNVSTIWLPVSLLPGISVSLQFYLVPLSSFMLTLGISSGPGRREEVSKGLCTKLL